MNLPGFMNSHHFPIFGINEIRYSTEISLKSGITFTHLSISSDSGCVVDSPTTIIPAVFPAVIPASESSNTIQNSGEILHFFAPNKKQSGAGLLFSISLAETIISNMVSKCFSCSTLFSFNSDELVTKAILIPRYRSSSKKLRAPGISGNKTFSSKVLNLFKIFSI